MCQPGLINVVGPSAGSRSNIVAARLVFIAISILLFGRTLPAERWIEDSFADFADGRLDASGQNIYVSRDGRVRTIHRFDLNQDGLIDLVFNSTHDRFTSIPATQATVTPKGKITHTQLAVHGSRHVALADLNNDGHLDAAFCPNASGAQSERGFVTILWGGSDGWSPRRATSALPVSRATRIVAPDLNADGWRDLAILNGPKWLPHQSGLGEHRILRVYWGGPSGYSLARRTDQSFTGAIDLAVADFDSRAGDDLAILQSPGTHRSPQQWVTVLLSESTRKDRTRDRLEGGSLHVRLPTRSVAPASCMTAADADNDGLPDLLVGTTGQVAYLLPGGKDRQWGQVITLAAPSTSHIAVGDLDGDGQPDLALTNFAQARAGGGEAAGAADGSGAVVHVLWGQADKNGRTGFSGKRGTQFPVRHAAASAIGDLNGDRRPDLVVVAHQGTESMTTDSVVFLGTGNRKLRRVGGRLTTTGATHVALAPPEKGLPARAVFCNSVGGTVGEAVPLQVYWGNRDGFSAKRVWTIPFASGYESTAADLNGDGFTDFVAINSGHAGEIALKSPHLGVNIFWGGRDGFDLEKRRTVLREYNLGTSNVADLDRDGYLDLVLGQFGPGRGVKDAALIIHYGGPKGFSPERRVAIRSPGRSISTVVADLDNDGWLDITVNSYDRDVVRVFRGGPDGFSEQRQVQLTVHNAIDVETADLDADGYLDLVIGSYVDRIAGDHDTGTTIFWGSPKGFRHSNARWLPGFTPIGHCIADFDADGFLDLFSPHYHANGTRESIPSYLYWGGRDGFSIERRTSLICDSAHDALAADFDRDGRLDLAVVCHCVDGRHHARSKVFYNRGRRFTRPEITELPTHGPHWMWHEDMGHIAHRRWEQVYESSVCKLKAPATRGTLAFTAEVPRGTRLVFSVRSASRQDELAARTWKPLKGKEFKLARGDRYLQYRALFVSDNGDRYPDLDRVTVELER